MNGMSVSVAKIAELLDLKNYTKDMDLKKQMIHSADVNRPALQLTGYFDHFDNQRIQIIGYVEYTFLERMDPEEKERIYDQLLACRIPCLIFCRNMRPDKILVE